MDGSLGHPSHLNCNEACDLLRAIANERRPAAKPGVFFVAFNARSTATRARRAAIAAWSAMVGAMLLARIVDDEKLSKEILKETRASLPLA